MPKDNKSLKNNFKGIISTLFDNKIQGIINSFNATVEVKHAGIKGDIREIEIRDILKELVPINMEVSSGIIADSEGKQSHQMDIVIYDKNIMPSIINYQHLGFFPIDAVIYAIEVKSLIDKRTLEKDVIVKFNNLRSLNKLNSNRNHNTALIAYSSSRKQKSELQRYYEVSPKMITEPDITIMAVLDRAEYYYLHHEIVNYYGHYIYHVTWRGNKNLENATNTLKYFLTGTMNTLFPEPIGYYLLGKGKSTIFSISIFYNGKLLYQEFDFQNGLGINYIPTYSLNSQNEIEVEKVDKISE